MAASRDVAAWALLAVGLVAIALVGGCASPPRPVVTTTRVAVPVVVPCRRPPVARPTLTIPHVVTQPGADLGAKVAAIQADLAAWMTYALGLEAVDGACASIDPLDQSALSVPAGPADQ